jgi:hypothetical protein
VIIADTRSSMVAANAAATIVCAFDFDLSQAQRATLDGACGAPLNSARSAWEYLVKSGAQRLDTARSAWEVL